MSLQVWLESFLSDHGGVAGTVHFLKGDVLELVASFNIPASVARATLAIPKGKGMAGLAWERDQVVSTCNLKTDTSGDVRTGARAVNAQAALAIPVHGPAGELRAVVGMAFMGERDFGDSELERFQHAAEALPGAA